VIEDLWMNIKAWMEKNVPSTEVSFLPGLKDKDFEVLSPWFPNLPEDFLALWKINNGSVKSAPSTPLMGFYLLDIELIVYQMKSWRLIAGDMDEDGINEIDRFVYPPGTARRNYVHRNYLFFAQDFRGNYLVIDLDPDLLGVIGQITHVGGEDKDKYIIAESLTHFLVLINSINADENLKIGLDSIGNPIQYYEVEENKKIYNLLDLLPYLCSEHRLFNVK